MAKLTKAQIEAHKKELAALRAGKPSFLDDDSDLDLSKTGPVPKSKATGKKKSRAGKKPAK